MLAPTPTPQQIVSTILIHPDPVDYVVSLAKQITPESAKAAHNAALEATWGAVYNATYDAARKAARNAAYNAARGATWKAAGDTAYDATYDAAYDEALDIAWIAAGDATYMAGACVVKDLITHDQLLVLAEAFHRHLPETIDI